MLKLNYFLCAATLESELRCLQEIEPELQILHSITRMEKLKFQNNENEFVKKRAKILYVCMC